MGPMGRGGRALQQKRMDQGGRALSGAAVGLNDANECTCCWRPPRPNPRHRVLIILARSPDVPPRPRRYHCKIPSLLHPLSGCLALPFVLLCFPLLGLPIPVQPPLNDRAFFRSPVGECCVACSLVGWARRAKQQQLRRTVEVCQAAQLQNSCPSVCRWQLWQRG
jgi:hypothetical protein